MAEPLLCTQCGAVTSPKRVTPGSTWVTLILLLFFIIPGIIYMHWRHTSIYAACRKCGSKNLVPLNSPFGREMVATRPLVAASLAEEKQRQKDFMIGAAVFAGILLLLVIMMWLNS